MHAQGRLAARRSPSPRRNPEVIVALQGTLDTFALPDVLRLLATTRKTGRLLVHGNRGEGSVWVDGGSVVAAEAAAVASGTAAGEVIFELLRHTEGSFTFDASSSPTDAGAPTEVEPLLVDAERQLAEWRDIAAVVPSLDAWVTLAPELPGPEAVVDAARWRTIVTVGSGTTVGSIGQTLGLGEVPVSRLVKDLVELGFGTVTPVAPVPEARDFAADSSDGGLFSERHKVPDIGIDLGPFANAPSPGSNGAPRAEPFVFDSISPEPRPARGTQPPTDDRPAPPAPALRTPPPLPHPTLDTGAHRSNAGDDDSMEADEVARQLAALSPKAARAVAAAAKAETVEEREAALAEVIGDDDKPINRGLLLKFLSSVRS
jgi:hypothetical protein